VHVLVFLQLHWSESFLIFYFSSVLKFLFDDPMFCIVSSIFRSHGIGYSENAAIIDTWRFICDKRT